MRGSRTPPYQVGLFPQQHRVLEFGWVLPHFRTVCVHGRTHTSAMDGGVRVLKWGNTHPNPPHTPRPPHNSAPPTSEPLRTKPPPAISPSPQPPPTDLS